MEELLEHLNEPQKKAVTHTSGPLLIIAGAGSGKTRVLTSRVVYLMSHGVKPEQICAITFTNKAAQEMKERIMRSLKHSRAPFIGTFHSLCAYILRVEQHPFPQFVIYDAHDQLQLIKDIVRERDMQGEAFSPYAYKDYISKLKNGVSVHAGAYSSFAQSAERVYRAYQEKLFLNRALDFDDLLRLVVELFASKPFVRAKYQNRFTHILVDEYQDTNALQYRLVSELAHTHKNVCAVGDADQAIYGWRGADFKNILSFEQDYPNTTVIKLEENYRSTQTILAAAQAIIEKNKMRKAKTLWTRRHEGDKIRIASYANQDEEARATIQKIIGLSRNGISLRDIVVLYRTNAQSRALEEACLAHSLPYRVIGAFRFYERKEIKDLLAYLRVIAYARDTLSLRRIINTPPRGLASIGEIWPVIENNGLNDEVLQRLSARKQKPMAHFIKQIDTLRRLKSTLLVSDLLKRAINEFSYIKHVSEAGDEAHERIENISELITIAQQFDDHGADGLEKFLESVALIQDSDTYDENKNVLSLMTLHAVKGLEFPSVFIVGLEEGIFPHSRAESPEEMEEERRLCYVGFTRAKEKLFLSFVKSRKQFGATLYNIPSRFLLDIPEHMAEFSESGLWDTEEILID